MVSLSKNEMRYFFLWHPDSTSQTYA